MTPAGFEPAVSMRSLPGRLTRRYQFHTRTYNRWWDSNPQSLGVFPVKLTSITVEVCDQYTLYNHYYHLWDRDQMANTRIVIKVYYHDLRCKTIHQ